MHLILCMTWSSTLSCSVLTSLDPSLLKLQNGVSWLRSSHQCDHEKLFPSCSIIIIVEYVSILSEVGQTLLKRFYQKNNCIILDCRYGIPGIAISHTYRNAFLLKGICWSSFTRGRLIAPWVNKTSTSICHILGYYY